MANVILDNLIAQGKIKPMIVVMPLGYGTPDMIKLKQASWDHPDVKQLNFDNFRKSLLTEVIPHGRKRVSGLHQARRPALSPASRWEARKAF